MPGLAGVVGEAGADEGEARLGGIAASRASPPAIAGQGAAARAGAASRHVAVSEQAGGVASERERGEAMGDANRDGRGDGCAGPRR